MKNRQLNYLCCDIFDIKEIFIQKKHKIQSNIKILESENLDFLDFFRHRLISFQLLVYIKNVKTFLFFMFKLEH